jgi:hypothetical protein
MIQAGNRAMIHSGNHAMTPEGNREMIQARNAQPRSESHQARALRGAADRLETCTRRRSVRTTAKKPKKKESKILQNEATKPNRISKSAGKIGQNEAKRSQNSQIVDLDKSFGISKPVFAVASFNQFKARLAPQDRPGDKSATGQRYASLYLAYA